MSNAPTSPGNPSGFQAAYLRLLEFFSMQPGEAARSLLVFSYLFLIIASYGVIKTVRDALFLEVYGAKKLPYAMIGIAVLAGVTATLYVRLARRWSTANLVFGSLIFFAVNILVFWWLIREGQSWILPVFYLWVGVYGVLSTTQVWTVASELFTTREAKRIFGVVGAGGILGSVAGFSLAGSLPDKIGAANLLLVVFAMLLVAAVLVLASKRLRTVPEPVSAGQSRPSSLQQSMQLIASSPHLRLIAGLVFITAVATSMADYQFKAVVDGAFDDGDALATFLGKVYGAISVVSFLVQILLTSRLLASVGVGFSILVLPLSLGLGSAALFASGALWAAVALKGSDGSLKHSLDRSCRELMYLPVPAVVRGQAKSTIDTVVDRLGDGAAGVLLLLVTNLLGLGLRGSLVASFIIIAIWIFIALRLRSAYVSQLGMTLGRRRARIEELPAAEDADTRRAVDRVLREGGEYEKVALLEWAGRNDIPVDETILLGLARDRDSLAVRNAALALLLHTDETELPAELLADLESEGQTVLVAAIDLLVEPEGEKLQERLEVLLDQAGETTRLSVVAFMLRRLGPEFEPFARRVFDALLAPGAPPPARAAAVRAMALLPADSPLLDHLETALGDRHALVAGAAAETAARLGRTDLVPRLIQLLARPPLRQALRQAFKIYGERCVPFLLEALDARATSADARRRMPRVLGELCTPRTVDALVAALDDEDSWVREGSLEALRGIRRYAPEIRPIASSRLHARMFEQMSAYEALQAVEDALRDDPDAVNEGMIWLVDALESERFRILGRIFMLLSLEHPVLDMARSWFAVRSGSPTERANAVELLDNVLSKDVKSRLLGLLEPSGHSMARTWRTRQERPSRRAALRRLIEGDDPWIAACAIYAGRQTETTGLDEVVQRAAMSPHAVLREEAMAFIAVTERGTDA